MSFSWNSILNLLSTFSKHSTKCTSLFFRNLIFNTHRFALIILIIACVELHFIITRAVPNISSHVFNPSDYSGHHGGQITMLSGYKLSLLVHDILSIYCNQDNLIGKKQNHFHLQKYQWDICYDLPLLESHLPERRHKINNFRQFKTVPNCLNNMSVTCFIEAARWQTG